MPLADGTAWADVVMTLTPDEVQADLYHDHPADRIKQGTALMFVHGFAVHSNFIEPRADLYCLGDRAKVAKPHGALRNAHDLGLSPYRTRHAAGGGRRQKAPRLLPTGLLIGCGGRI